MSKKKKFRSSGVKPGNWLLWNRGQWRGWAVGKVSELTPDIVRVKTAHLGNLVWQSSDLSEDVQSGRVFIVNPEQICFLLADQLELLAETEEDPITVELINEAVENLDLATNRLADIKVRKGG